MEEQEKEHVKKQTHYAQIRNDLSVYADENRHMKKFLETIPDLLDESSRQILRYCEEERYIFIKENGRWRRKDDVEKNQERRALRDLGNELERARRSLSNTLKDINKRPEDREI